MSAVYPVGPIAEGIGLNVTVMSYSGQVHFGLFACRRLVPELSEVARCTWMHALAELTVCALSAQGATA